MLLKALVMLESYLWWFCLLGRQIATAAWVSWFWSMFQLTTQKILLIIYKTCDSHHTLYGFYLGQIFQSLTWLFSDIMPFIAAYENSKKWSWVYGFPASILIFYFWSRKPEPSLWLFSRKQFMAARLWCFWNVTEFFYLPE